MEGVGEITADTWALCVQNVISIENEMWEMDSYVDRLVNGVEALVIPYEPDEDNIDDPDDTFYKI